MTSREFDVVVWGATGFTGRLVAEHFAGHPECADIDWAIAGRNRDKLQQLATEVGDPPVLVGDALDRSSLDDIAQRTNVVCTTVGPYARFGSHLVAACIDAETDYCDLTGEVHWIREMIDTHHENARKRNVRIVHCCGFDSIPSDVGTFVVQSEAVERLGRPCGAVRALISSLQGGVSGGTAASTAGVISAAKEDPDVRRIVADPYGLVPDPPPHRVDGGLQRIPRYDDAIDRWTAPFIMAAINEKVVRRTNALLNYRYGERFSYSEAFQSGAGLRGALRATATAAATGGFAAAMMLRPTRKLLQRFVLPDSGEGPSDVERGRFSMKLIGLQSTDADNPEVVVDVSSELDPGYGATVRMLAESALSLAFDDHPDCLQGGVLTPAAAFGDAIVDRLRQADVEIEVAG